MVGLAVVVVSGIASATLVQLTVEGVVDTAESNPFGISASDTFSIMALYDDMLLSAQGLKASISARGRATRSRW